jgi:hypothetical protein
VSSRAERLLSGPRGRRLCVELAMAADPAVCTAAFALGYQLDPGRGLSRVLLTFESDQNSSEPGDEPAPTVAGLVSAVAALGAPRVEPGLIQSALQRTVDFARYWQEPDGEDRLAALPEVAAAPGWALVAREWDAIHLPVSAYLEIAGRAIKVAKETASVVAGWDPTPASGSLAPSPLPLEHPNGGNATTMTAGSSPRDTASLGPVAHDFAGDTS